MSEFIRIITHARRFKSAVKEVGVERLQEIKVKLEEIIADRIAEEETAKIENEKRLQKIREYREKLAADGIDPEELQDGSSEKTGKRAPRQPKYEIWDKNGRHITWTGQGRTPNIFKARIEAGDSIETFLIEQ